MLNLPLQRNLKTGKIHDELIYNLYMYRLHIYVNVYIYTHTHTHTYIYIYIYITFERGLIILIPQRAEQFKPMVKVCNQPSGEKQSIAQLLPVKL